MKYKRMIISLPLLSIGLVHTSCKKEGCTVEKATNYNEEAKEDDGSCEYSFDQYDGVPSTYQFSRDGENTVSFSGQTERLNMMEEITSYVKSAHTPGVSLSSSKLKEMFANDGGHFSFSSEKQLRNKIAGEDAVILADLDSWIEHVAALSDTTVSGEYNAEANRAGVWGDASKSYLLDENGIELAQVIEKSTMGSCFLYQITHVYLGEGKMEVDNETVESGKSYTAMEHHWDEAYGYFADVDFPNGENRFWAKYCEKVDGALGTSEALGTAFRTGRWAIMDKDYNLRDEQITIINSELERVCAGTAIHYINAALADLGDTGVRSHSLSEARGFIYSLQFIKDGNFSQTDVTNYLPKLDNLYDVTASDLNQLKDDIATKAGISNEADAL